MRIVIASCWNYRDAWKPVTQLLRHFWKEPRPKIWLATDILLEDQTYFGLTGLVDGFHWFEKAATWCEVVAGAVTDDEPILLLQEDFFLNAPVELALVEHALSLFRSHWLGAIRLYPCPGASEPSDDPFFAPVERGTRYRTSCQASIWRPSYLRQIVAQFTTPADFELAGSDWASAHLPEEVWAFKREVMPWPLQYFCSAISRGKWNPSALAFCETLGIEVDRSRRPVEC